KNKRPIIIIVILLVLVAAGIWIWQHREATGIGSIRVAANLPMSGPLATYGVAVREGANMALDEVPSSGGARAAKIVVDWQDNAGDPKTAVSILQKQLLALPNLYVSGVKPQTMAIKDEISQQNIPHFVWIFDAHINQQNNNNF